jgi:allantoin racemase
MRILVVNPNTNRSMTDTIGATARRYASAGTEIVPLTARHGVDGIDSNFESLLSAVAVLDLLATFEGGFDAVVLAGFGEYGREGVQEIIDVPVLDIAECAAHAAMLVGRSYSVVTTMARSIGPIEDRLTVAGLSARCASVRATGLSTVQFAADREAALHAVLAQARLAVEQDRAEVICLGCAAMAGLDNAVTRALGVPVVDGVAAGVRFAEALHGMGLRTSKVGTYAAPQAKRIVGFPLSRPAG